ncbi:hypothetical protein VNO77_01320 [Canavalia gladiata]|uniref:Secreted protein n=1 Tax=Canavalia gladiata TaxID=3824 RepID=A0AAN9MXI4_CANGL
MLVIVIFSLYLLAGMKLYNGCLIKSILAITVVQPEPEFGINKWEKRERKQPFFPFWSVGPLWGPHRREHFVRIRY